MKLTEIDKNIKSKEIDIIVRRNFSYNEPTPSYQGKKHIIQYIIPGNQLFMQRKLYTLTNQSPATVYINANVCGKQLDDTVTQMTPSKFITIQNSLQAWKDASAVNSTGTSGEEMRFSSQHPHGGS